MTEQELRTLSDFATGPIDGYDVHRVRPLLARLLAEHRELRHHAFSADAKYTAIVKQAGLLHGELVGKKVLILAAVRQAYDEASTNPDMTTDNFMQLIQQRLNKEQA